MPEQVNYLVHRLARRNESDWGIIFTECDNKPIDEDKNAEYNPNNEPTPEDNIFDLNNYFPGNFPTGAQTPKLQKWHTNN